MPNVKWEDVGGLEEVKKSILDTVQVHIYMRPDSTEFRLCFLVVFLYFFYVCLKLEALRNCCLHIYDEILIVVENFFCLIGATLRTVPSTYHYCCFA